MFASKQAFYLFLIQVFAMQVIFANSSSSQELNEVKIQFFMRDAQLEKVFQELESLTQFKFGYDRQVLSPNVKLSFAENETSLRDVLLKVAEKAELKFKRIGAHILVLKDKRLDKAEEKIETLPERTIRGKVADGKTGEGLPGATVAIKGYPNLGVVTNNDGSFEVSVPDDAKALIVSFVGYIKREVRIGQRSFVDVSLESDLTQLANVEVTGYKLQNTEAINLKRLTPAIGEFLSQDNIGRLPDFAAADAARRIAGVHTVFQEDEATNVSVRGLPPIFTYSTIDGMFLPSGSRGSRVANFETIPSSAIARIEVFKSRTPDQDGNAIGGTFNLKTRSAFDHDDLFVTGRATLGKYDFDEIPRSEQFRNTVDQNGLSIRSDLTLSKRFGGRKQFGVVLSGSYNRKDRDEFKVPKRNYNFLNDDLSLPVPDRFYGTTYDNLIERFGGFGKLEYKPNEKFYAAISANYYKKTDDEVRMENRFRNFDIDESTVSTAGGRFNGGRVQLAYDHFIIEHRVTNAIFTTGYESGKSKLDGQFGITHGYLGQDGPWGGFNFNFDDQLSGSYTLGLDIDDFTLNFDDPSVYTNPDNWDSYYVGGRLYRDDEDAVVGSFNYAYNMDYNVDGFGFKTGFAYRNIEHQFDRIDQSVNADGSIPLTFADFPLQSYFHPFFNGGRVGLIHFDTDMFEDWVRDNTNIDGRNNNFGTLYNRAGAYNLSNRFVIDETVSAFYAMGRFRMNNLSVVGGFRYEDTQTDLTRVPEINGTRDENVTLTQQNNYSNFLPSLNATLDLTPKVRVKAGYNRSIGRGDYQQIAPVAFVDDANERRSEGNPNLRPRIADNFDVTMEYYFDRGSSLFAFGFFHKNVKDDIQSEQFVDPSNGYLVSSTFNALGFDVSGFELNLIKSDFEGVLPGFLKNFGVSSNFTFISGRREIANDQYVSSIANMPRTILNAQLFYQAEKFDARLAFNHVGDHVRHARDSNPSDEINDDTYWKAFSQFDFAANYYINDKYSIFFEARNFTNADRGYTRGRNLLIEDVIFGGSLWLGVTFRFD